MLGLFKDFGKKATDLNKKEFYDAKAAKKATVKSSTGGAKFETFMQKNGEGSATKTEFKLDFKDESMEFKNKIEASEKLGKDEEGKDKWSQDAKYTMEGTCFNVMDGFDATVEVKAPVNCGEESKSTISSISPGLNYTTADINSSTKLNVDLSDNSFTLDTRNAFKAMDGLNLGFNLLGLSTDGEVGVKVGATYTCGDMLLAAFANGSNTKETYGKKEKAAEEKEKAAAFQFGAISASMFQQVNKGLSVAAEASYGKSCDGANNDLVKDEDPAFTCKIGSSYSLSGTSTIKAKLTNQGVCESTGLDFAWIQKLNGNSSATMAWTFQEKKGPAMSFTYTLDA